MNMRIQTTKRVSFEWRDVLKLVMTELTTKHPELAGAALTDYQTTGLYLCGRSDVDKIGFALTFDCRSTPVKNGDSE